MTYLSNLEFPRHIAFGAQRSPWWATTIVTVQGGWEQRNQQWAHARHEYDVSFAVRTAERYAEILAHWMAARGPLHSFPFKDFLDYKALGAEGVLLATDTPEVFQLAKQYGEGSSAYQRPITRPDTGTVALYLLGSPVVYPVSAAGLVNTAAHSPPIDPDDMTWTGHFKVPVRYGVDRLPAMVQNRQAGGGELLVSVDSVPLLEVRE